MRRHFSNTLILCTFATATLAGPPGQWDSAQVSTVRPLEAKMEGLSDGGGTGGVDDFAVWLSIVLSNSGGLNRLEAIRTPSPFDGSGVTNTPLDSSATLFALGDICADGNTAVVPYIKDFNVEVARFDGNNWSTQTIPGTTVNNFTTADCGRTPNGLFITAQDFNDNELEIFRSTDGGNDFTFYGRYSDVRGPFSGAVRDQLATDPNGNAAAIMSQQGNGQIRVTSFDTSANFPAQPTHTTIVNLAAPPGSFKVVRESTAISRPAGVFFFSYNADDVARTIDFDSNNPAGFSASSLGPINSAATHFPFQGATGVFVDGEQPSTNVLWGDFFEVDPGGLFTTDPAYPLAGVGGPVDGCLATTMDLQRVSYYTGPDATGQNTRLYSRFELPLAVFADGFESGDVSSWSCE